MNIIWTGQARHRFDMTIAYLLEEWTVKEAQNFIDAVAKMEAYLKDFPNAFPISNKKSYLRKAVLGKHNSLVYEVDGENIVLITFVQNIQNHDY